MRCHFLRPSSGHGAKWPREQWQLDQEEGQKVKGGSRALTRGMPTGWGLLAKGYPSPIPGPFTVLTCWASRKALHLSEE